MCGAAAAAALALALIALVTAELCAGTQVDSDSDSELELPSALAAVKRSVILDSNDSEPAAATDKLGEALAEIPS